MRVPRQIPRRFSAAALCCLLLVGGLPRMWCLCPDADCRAACNAGAAPLAPEHSQPACCPRCASQPSEQGETDGNLPGFSGSECPCQVLVAQLVLPSAPRAVEMTAASVQWLARGDAGQQLRPGRSAEHSISAVVINLPPDDPVSRAQILRL
jgi:hypothetical protein